MRHHWLLQQLLHQLDRHLTSLYHDVPPPLSSSSLLLDRPSYYRPEDKPSKKDLLWQCIVIENIPSLRRHLLLDEYFHESPLWV